MNILINIISYVFIFTTLYFEVFLIISFFEKKNGKSKKNLGAIERPVTILVPVYNEEKTIAGTINSLLAIDYPHEKIHIIVINDGSNDDTRKVLEQYNKNKRVQIVDKENGGKHTALNLGLTLVKTDFVGCLDADSFVFPNALRNIMKHFSDPDVMCVTPSTIVWQPKKLIQKMQMAEYHYGNFIRQAMSLIGAIHIAPGPFSFFRMKTFEIIGNYKHAHNTEDMEIAMRMQKHHLKIIHAGNAVVYTTSPNSIKKLYKQRVRWVSGFFGNLIDYRWMIMNKKYGNLGMLVLPMAIFSVLLVVPFIISKLYRFIWNTYNTFRNLVIQGVPKDWAINFDPFFIDTSIVTILSIAMLSIVILILGKSRQITSGKWKLSFDFLFLLLYILIAPFWLIKSIYNSLLNKKTAWR